MRVSVGVIKKLSNIDLLKSSSSAGISPDLKVISILNEDRLCFVPVAHQCSSLIHITHINGYAWQEDFADSGRYRIIALTTFNQLCLFELYVPHYKNGVCKCVLTSIFEWNMHKLSDTLQDLQTAINKAGSFKILSFCSSELIILIDNKLILTLNILLEKSPVVASAESISEEEFAACHSYLAGDFIVLLNHTKTMLSVYSLINKMKYHEWDITSFTSHDKLKTTVNVMFVADVDLQYIVICVGRQNIYWLKCSLQHLRKTQTTEAVGHQRKSTVTAFVKQFPSLMKVSESARGVPSKAQFGKWCNLTLPDDLAEMTVKDIFLLDEKLWCFCCDDITACVAVINLESGIATISERLRMPATIIRASGDPGSSPFFLLGQDSISVILVDLGPEKLVNELMTYTHSGAAESLSMLNSWQSIQVNFGVLQQGLRNRQLDTVEFFLRMHAEAFHQMWSAREDTQKEEWVAQLRLESHNWNQILLLVLNTVRINMNDSSSWQFASHLLQMILSTLVNLLHTVVENTTCHSEPENEAKMTELNEVFQINLQLFKYLHEARLCLHGNDSKRMESPSIPVLSSESDIFPPVIQDRFKLWSQKSWKEAIKDAVQNGYVALVQTHLSIAQKENYITGKGNILDVIISTGMEFVLDALQQGSLNSAIKMLSNMGLSVDEELLKIFKTTIYRDFRKILLPELKKRNLLSQHDDEIASFLFVVENLYPCTSFEQTKILYTDKNTFSCSSVFPTSTLLSTVKPELCALKTGDLMGPMYNSSETGSYCCLVLDWVISWRKDIQERILAYHVLKENRRSLLPHISRQTVWHYLLEHGDKASLKKWVKNYLGLLHDFPLEEGPFKWPLDGVMVNTIKGATPAHIEEYVLNKLGSNGIFCEEELEDISQFLQRLGHIQYDLSDNQLFLSKRSTISFPDFCHRIIHYCLQFKLFNLLHLFLANTWNSVQLPTCPICCKPLLSMMIAICQWSQKPEDPTLAFHAIMASAVKSYNLSNSTLEDLWSNAPLPVFLASILFSPLSIEEFFRCADEKSYNIAALRSALTPYPLLHDALFYSDRVSYILQPDVILYQLLQGNSVFDSSRLFGWQKASIKNEEASNEMPHFSLPSLVEQYGLKEELTYIYYLLEGRPSFAYAKFIAKELTEGRLPNTTRIHSVCKEVAVLAFSHYTDYKVTSSCVVFTEMLGQDSLRLRVHLVVASLIHAYYACNHGANKDPELSAADIAYLLEQSLDDKESAYQLLHLLESSIIQQWQMLKNRSPMEIAIWFPAVAFSSLNQLEPCLTYLSECAKSGDWLRFLVYSQLYQITKEQVLKLLPEFPTTCLTDHLHNALQVKTKKDSRKPKFKSPRNIRNALYSKIGFSKAAVTSHDCSSAPEMSSDDDNNDDDSASVGRSDTISSSSDIDVESLTYARELFGQILYCHESVSPWRSLIKVCLNIGNPILAVFAACYEDSSLLNCFCAWLTTSLNRNKISKSGQPDLVDNASCTWNLDYIEKILENTMKNRNITFLRQGVMLFLPDSPLLPLLDFLVAFIICKQYDSSSTKQYLNDFRDKMESHRCTKVDNSPLNTPEWVEKMCAQFLTTAVILCNNSFERLLLLRCLSFSRIQNSFSSNVKVPDFNKLYLLMQHVGDSAISVSVEQLILSDDDSDYIKECWQIVKSLQKLNHFNEAIKFAKVAKLPLDGVIIYQLKHEADNHHKCVSALVQSDSSSCLTFWEEVNKTLQKNRVKAYMAAQFFKDQHVLARSYNEKYFVMKLAFEWLNNDTLKNKDVSLLSQWKIELLYLCIKAEEEREMHCKDDLGKVMVTLPLDGSSVSHKTWDFSFLSFSHHAKEGLFLQTENELEQDLLERLINKLLTTGHLGHAYYLAHVFKCKINALEGIMTCYKLVKKDILPPNSKKAKSHHSLPVVSKLPLECLNSEQKEVASLIEQIASENEYAATACIWILVYYYVASVLCCPFDSVICEDPFVLLKKILTSNTSEKYYIAESVISVHSLSVNDVGEFLSKEIISLLQMYFSDLAKTPVDKTSFKTELYNPSRGSKGLLQLIWLCSDSSVLGNKLMKAAKCEIEQYQKSGAKSSLWLAVKLYAHSHDCFTASCNMEGISKVLQKVRVLAQILTEAEEFPLLVQLLTGIGRFSEMTYIFNILMEHHHFELLFHKSMEEVPNLHLALLDYFKRHPPSDSDYYSMLAFTFNSFREIAEISESRAHYILNSLKKQNYKNPALREQLQSATQFLSSASDSYSKASCVRHAQKCANHAKLVALQLFLLHSDTWVIQLKDEEVHMFIGKHKKFVESYIVAEAYEWHQSWSQAIYYNVVENGDWNYFREYEACLGFTPHLVEEVAKKFHHSLCKTENSIKNMKRLLNLWTNVELKYKLAINMGFHDIAKDLLKDEKSAYLQDLFVK